MAKHAKKSSGKGGFIALCLFAVALTAALLIMLVIFARDPELAPPSICKDIALAVPAVTLVVVIVTLFQKMNALKRGEE